MTRQYFNANKQDASIYRKWNKSTVCCYEHNMICGICPNREIFCNIQTDAHNRYGIKQIKYATLMTFANCGKPKLELIDDEQ